ncbi:ParB N-terminal domain-containing protein [bacterium]|nr:ParB N-terminal domain-containing protein [bacterium]
MKARTAAAADLYQNEERPSQLIALSAIIDNEPRKYYPDQESFTENIAQLGVLNPILLTPVGEKYKVIAGRRRLKACRQLAAEGRLMYGKSIPAIICPPKNLEAMELSENLHRNDLDVFEEAELLEHFREVSGLKFATDVARALNLHERTVQRTLLVNDISHEIKEDYFAFTKETLNELGYIPFKKTQIFELAAKPKSKQAEVWAAMKAKALKERANRQPKEDTHYPHMSDQPAIPFTNKKELPPLANEKVSASVVEDNEPNQISEDDNFIESDSASQDEERIGFKNGTIDLEARVDDYQYWLMAVRDDLCKFNPAAYQPENPERFLEDLEIFESSLVDTANTMRDIRMKILSGPEAVQEQLSSLEAEVVDDIQPSRRTESAPDLSKNSFDELYRRMIAHMPQEEITAYEEMFYEKRLLNPLIKKRNPDLHQQLLTNLIIQDLNEQRFKEAPLER